MNIKPISRWFLLLVALIAIATVALIIKTKPAVVPTNTALPTISVALLSIKKTSMQALTHVVGTLVPKRQVTLYFRSNGIVANKPLKVGDIVEENQLLASLESSAEQDLVQKAETDVNLEQASIVRDKQLLGLSEQTLVLAKNEFQRLTKLSKKNMASKSGLDTSRRALLQQQIDAAKLRHAVNTADSRLRLKQYLLEEAKRKLSYTQLTAPWKGTINQLFIEKGDYVSPTKKALELVDLEQLKLLLHVGSQVASVIHLGQKIKVVVNQKEYISEVYSKQSSPDSSTFTYTIELLLPALDLQAGQLAEASIALNNLNNIIVIPSSAILSDEGQFFVFRYHQGKIKKTPVRIGQQYQGKTHIISGLTTADQIVKSNVSTLSDNQKVDIK